MNEELIEYFIDKDESISIPVPPLLGLFILKLLSWDEKKPGREKDLEDLNIILENYWHFVEDEAFEEHLDLFIDGFKTELAGARILGRHLKTTLIKSTVLKKTIIRILEEQACALDPPGLLLKKFAVDRDKPIDAIKEQLDEILKGVNE